MSWRDQLQQASFRGVAFHAVSDSGTFGRRSVLHEFPFRDLPYVEDMGRKAREIRVVGFLLGDDYVTALDNLIDAIEQPGPGTLVHPTFGELTVSISDGGVTVDQSTAEGGLARISFACIESGEARFPSATLATQDVLTGRADDLLDINAASFLRRFSLAGLPEWAQQLSLDRATDFLDMVRDAVSRLANVAAGRGTILGLLGALEPLLGDLLRDGGQFTRQVGDLVATIRTALPTDVAVQVLGNLGDFGVGAPHVPASTPVRERDEDNGTAMIEFVRAAVAAERAKAVVSIDFADYTAAASVRDSLGAQIDAVAEVTADDTLYDALSAMRAAAVRDITVRGADLARLVTITPQATRPALVLAHDLYQDAARDADILARNRIAHPGFVPAGASLEVPVDA